MPSWISLSFQDSASPAMSELSCLHDHIMTIMFSVIVLISYVMLYMVLNTKFYKFLSEGTLIETIWSMVPAFLLVILVLPSMKVLYMVEDVKTPSMTFKILAHQWYWTYISPLWANIILFSENSMSCCYETDSMMSSENSLKLSSPRLLSCSEDLIFPANTTSRLLISSTDVLHSFSLPSLGLKVDAVPGRINQIFSNPSRVGLFFGQCSEICGSNHSFMPISVKVMDLSSYVKFSEEKSIEIISEQMIFI